MNWKSPGNKAVLDQSVKQLKCILSSSSYLFDLGPHATLDYPELSTLGPQQTSLPLAMLWAWKVSRH